VHAIELGKEQEDRTIIAFGGAAPLHACQLAEALGITKIVIPTSAGVGSAIGFLRANIAYEVARSLYVELKSFEPENINKLFKNMFHEANAVVTLGTAEAELKETRIVFMRYCGQGHEIPVPIQNRELNIEDGEVLFLAFENEYKKLFGRTIPKLGVEAMTWSLTLSTDRPLPKKKSFFEFNKEIKPKEYRRVFNTVKSSFDKIPVFNRDDLAAGNMLQGPAIVIEDETTTFVSNKFNACINNLNYIELITKETQK
jgi:N-methylhydantoinase A